MSDPKYKCKDGGMYHIDGYRVPDDEPTMLLRGKDLGALKVVCEYVSMLMDQPMNATIDSHLESSTERLIAFYRYQKQNPELQSIGCSVRDHPALAGETMKRAREIIEELGAVK